MQDYSPPAVTFSNPKIQSHINSISMHHLLLFSRYGAGDSRSGFANLQHHSLGILPDIMHSDASRRSEIQKISWVGDV